jgi:arginyl-tRNA synthetase
MSAIAAAPSSATPSPTCWRSGYDVTKEYYINDAGAQIDVLGKSVFLRYREALGDEIGEIPAGLYPGDYLVPVGQALAEEFGRGCCRCRRTRRFRSSRTRPSTQ